ncbi:MAG: zinc-dependent peptidase [Bacteroidia bacterium]
MPSNLLKQKNPYFKNLSPDAQELFISRLFVFMENKSFVGREGLVITDEMRVLISAAAVQLTFGLKDYTISHLHTINIFPKIFFSRYLNQNLKGLNTQNGVLSLSWNDFKEGFAIEDDKINLGLHELAHALNIDLDEEGNYDEHFSAYFEQWPTVAQSDFNALKEKKKTFLRSYGGTNMHEFFAVCVEHFFEAPAQFKKELPHLYNFLMLMLNQDPLNVKGDYAVRVYAEKATDLAMVSQVDREAELNRIVMNNSRSEERYSVIISTIRENGIYVAMVATFVGLFGGIPLLIWFWSTTVVSIGALFIMLFACGAVGLIQWKWLRPYLDLEYHQFAMYAFSGFGMCMINFIFCLNTLIHVSSAVKTFNVVSFSNDSSGLMVKLSGEAHSEAFERNVANYILDHHLDHFYEAKTITVDVTTGLFGFDMIRDCQLGH